MSTSSPLGHNTRQLPRKDRGACKFRVLIAEKRAKETGDSPAKRLEITAAMCFNFALVQMGQHQLALGHSTRQLPRKDRGACKFRALIAEKRAKETGDSPTKRLEITAAMCFN